MFSGFDTRDAAAVEQETRKVFAGLFPGADTTFIARSFAWASDCFHGRHPDYQPVDAPYHDYEHTLQGTLCLVRLMEGRHRSGVEPRLTPKWFELALLGILFHDTGYLKLRADLQGTGAKYTPIHVARGADFAGEFLGRRGFLPTETQAVQNMIRCTGINADLGSIPFTSELERQLGRALASADLIGQLAADDYVDKLPLLFQEFDESYRANPGHPSCLRRFNSVEELILGTPGFWIGYVLPRLEKEFQGQYRHLAAPGAEGRNAYLDGIQENMERLRHGQLSLQRP